MSPIEALKAAFALLPRHMSPSLEQPGRVVVPLLAMQHQENPQRVPKQIGGPAVGDYQFEKGGGIKGVLTHSTSRNAARDLCEALGVEPTVDAVYVALQTKNDTLDAGFARLLMWTDPERLPALGEVEATWKLYLRVWRPGAWWNGSPEQRQKLRQKFAVNYAKALEDMRQW